MERNGEVGEILSDTLGEYLRERWNHIFQETRIALPVSILFMYNKLLAALVSATG